MMMKKECKEKREEETTAHPIRFPDSSDTLADHVEDGTELGAVQIHNNVIASIARIAALKVGGVVEMSGNFVDDLAGMIGKKGDDRGIRVLLEDNAVSIELHLVLEFGVSIPQVAWQVQNQVREAVQQMTGKNVKAVNIVVQTLRFPNENDADPEEGGNG